MILHSVPKNVSYLLLALLFFTATGCRTNPVTGRRELSLVSPQQELELGRDYHPSLVMMYDAEYRDDEELTRYLEAIVERIHSVSHRRDMPVRFTLLNSSVVNAFALPGHVYATRGLVIKLESEAQFASIMAHEMGHVAAGHTAQRMTRQTLAALGIGLGGYALEDVSGAQGILMAGQVGLLLTELSYSREQERQADALSAYYMTQAGWNPEAAVEVQRMLGELSDREETVLAKYLSTHPPARERIADLRRMIDSGELPLNRVENDGVFAERWAERTGNIREVHDAYKKYDDATVALGRDEPDGALALTEEALEMQPLQAPFHRLKGDVLLENDRLDEARTAYERARELYPGYAHADIGLGRIAIAQGEYSEAEQRFLAAAEQFPAAVTPRHGLGLARYEQNNYREAIEPLAAAANALPDNAEIHYMLAVCYDRTGRYGAARESYLLAVQNGLKEPERGRALERIKAPD